MPNSMTIYGGKHCSVPDKLVREKEQQDEKEMRVKH
jgi:hypothetical protein